MEKTLINLEEKSNPLILRGDLQNIVRESQKENRTIITGTDILNSRKENPKTGNEYNFWFDTTLTSSSAIYRDHKGNGKIVINNTELLKDMNLTSATINGFPIIDYKGMSQEDFFKNIDAEVIPRKFLSNAYGTMPEYNIMLSQLCENADEINDYLSIATPTIKLNRLEHKPTLQSHFRQERTDMITCSHIVFENSTNGLHMHGAYNADMEGIYIAQKEIELPARKIISPVEIMKASVKGTYNNIFKKAS